MSTFLLTLLELSLTGALTACGVLVLRLLLRKAPKKYTAYLWAAVFLRAVCPTIFRSDFSLFHLLGMGVGNGGLDLFTGYQEARLSAALTPVGYLAERLGSALTPAAEAADGAVSATQGAAALEGASSTAGAGLAGTAAAGGVSLLTIFFIVWAVGAAVVLLAGLISGLRLRRQVAFAVRAEDGCYESDQISGAFIMGFFRPRIYLPAGLTGQERDFVRRHEEQHRKRRDPQLKFLAWVVAAIHWFNPLIWLSFVLMTGDLEQGCDEQVIDQLGETQRSAYSDFLLLLASPRPLAAGSPLAFGESAVKKRIRNLVFYRKPGRVATALCLFFVAVAAWFCLASPADAENIVIGGADGPTSIWLGSNGDTAGNDSEFNLVDEEIQQFAWKWESEVGLRGAEAAYEMLSPSLQARAEELGIEEVDGVRTMGYSSPFQADDVTLVFGVDETTPEKVDVTIVYPSMTSDPLWYAVRDDLVIEKTENGCQVTDWQRNWFLEITSWADFTAAYGNWFPPYLEATGDVEQSFADLLVQHDLDGGAPEYYEEYFYSPAIALQTTLHVSGADLTTQTNEDGSVDVTCRFADGEVTVRMVQPGLSEGSQIWVPKEWVQE